MDGRLFKTLQEEKTYRIYVTPAVLHILQVSVVVVLIFTKLLACKPFTLREFLCIPDTWRNRNHTLARLLIFLTDASRFERIEQFFPVRGHSFLSCDRDFATIKHSLRRYDRLYSVHEITELIIQSNASAKYEGVHPVFPRRAWDRLLSSTQQIHLVFPRGPRGAKFDPRCYSWLLNDALSSTQLLSIDEISDSDMVFGEARPRIRYRLPDIRLTSGESLGKTQPVRLKWKTTEENCNVRETAKWNCYTGCLTKLPSGFRSGEFGGRIICSLRPYLLLPNVHPDNHGRLLSNEEVQHAVGTRYPLRLKWKTTEENCNVRETAKWNCYTGCLTKPKRKKLGGFRSGEFGGHTIGSSRPHQLLPNVHPDNHGCLLEYDILAVFMLKLFEKVFQQVEVWS
ncbi:hypothetical protein ANN_21687 [Periplaneta americana]|uniref:Uncharacterized protein n=1 Tax=Periplaneta americana TaxID=6978 RepID=A0ABQ8S6H0_PERAM|nr:hypothetical protein ANN_21687 [Periplaneta americana]